MKRLRIGFAALVVLPASMWLIGCAQAANDTESSVKTEQVTAAQDESAIRALDSEWVKAVAEKNVNEIVGFYSNQAEALYPGGPMASGIEEITKSWANMVSLPGFGLTFSPTRIQIAHSGDMAYEIGDYQETVNNKSGKAQTSKGKYITIWGKQADGTWKALVDAPTTTQ